MLNIEAWHVYVHWKSLFMVYICARMCLLNTIFADGLISVGLILMNERFSLFEEIGIQKGINTRYPMWLLSVKSLCMAARKCTGCDTNTLTRIIVELCLMSTPQQQTPTIQQTILKVLIISPQHIIKPWIADTSLPHIAGSSHPLLCTWKTPLNGQLRHTYWIIVKSNLEIWTSEDPKHIAHINLHINPPDTDALITCTSIPPNML